jgi:hypothetical protein
MARKLPWLAGASKSTKGRAESSANGKRKRFEQPHEDGDDTTGPSRGSRTSESLEAN